MPFAHRLMEGPRTHRREHETTTLENRIVSDEDKIAFSDTTIKVTLHPPPFPAFSPHPALLPRPLRRASRPRSSASRPALSLSAAPLAPLVLLVPPEPRGKMLLDSQVRIPIAHLLSQTDETCPPAAPLPPSFPLPRCLFPSSSPLLLPRVRCHLCFHLAHTLEAL